MSKQSNLSKFNKYLDGKFKYSGFNYPNIDSEFVSGNKSQITIVCSKGHSFFKRADNFKNGSGCADCNKELKKITKTEIVNEEEVKSDILSLTKENQKLKDENERLLILIYGKEEDPLDEKEAKQYEISEVNRLYELFSEKLVIIRKRQKEFGAHERFTNNRNILTQNIKYLHERREVLVGDEKDFKYNYLRALDRKEDIRSYLDLSCDLCREAEQEVEEEKERIREAKYQKEEEERQRESEEEEADSLKDELRTRIPENQHHREFNDLLEELYEKISEKNKEFKNLIRKKELHGSYDRQDNHICFDDNDYTRLHELVDETSNIGKSTRKKLNKFVRTYASIEDFRTHNWDQERIDEAASY